MISSEINGYNGYKPKHEAETMQGLIPTLSQTKTKLNTSTITAGMERLQARREEDLGAHISVQHVHVSNHLRQNRNSAGILNNVIITIPDAKAKI